MEPIIYISGGALGDFINQLSVINEKYLTTGRKGMLYISSRGDVFTFGVERAYTDTEKLIKSQPYIHDYKIHNGEAFDVDLTTWRSSKLLMTASFAHIYNKEYSVEWGKHKWITCNDNPKYKDKILVHCSKKRLNYSLNYDGLFNNIPIEKFLFVTMDREEYSNFSAISKRSIPLELFTDYGLFIEAICNCGDFLGNLSSPFAVAFAAHRPCVAMLSDGVVQEAGRYYNFPSYITFYKYVR
jgi:hypothetical protein